MAEIKARIEVDTKVNDLLELHPALVLTEGGRVRCTLTNHEMLAQEKAITQHITGKKYRRLTKDLEKSFDFNQFPHIVPSTKKGHENHMFCQLTLKHLNRIPQHLLQHVNGKKYLKARVRWDECQVSGLPFVPTPLLNRTPKSKGGEVKSEVGIKRDGEENGTDVNESDDEYESFDEGEVSDADSFSDLYPAEYFQRLQISEQEEKETKMEIKKKPKKKTTKKQKLSDLKSNKKLVTKRKTVTKSQEVVTKRPKINKKSKKPQLLTFG